MVRFVANRCGASFTFYLIIRKCVIVIKKNTLGTCPTNLPTGYLSIPLWIFLYVLLSSTSTVSGAHELRVILEAGWNSL